MVQSNFVESEKQASVYCLRDPRTDEVRYVGLTTKTPASRRWAHWRQHGRKTNDDLGRWFLELAADDVAPIFEVLEIVPRSQAPAVERAWTQKLRGNLCNVMNNRPSNTPESHQLSLPGLKYIGRVLTDDHKTKLSDALKGKPKSAETREKITEAWKNDTTRRGRVQSEEERAKRRGQTPWNKGNSLPPTNCADCGVETKCRSERCRSCAMKLAAKNRGPLSDEHRSAISNSLKGKPSWKKGTTRPPEEYASRRGPRQKLEA